MFRSARLPVCLVVLCLLSLATVSAAVSPAAQKWLDRTAAAIEGKSYKVDYTAAVESEMMGQPMAANLAASVTYRDEKHMLMDVTLDMASLVVSEAPPRSVWINGEPRRRSKKLR